MDQTTNNEESSAVKSASGSSSAPGSPQRHLRSASFSQTSLSAAAALSASVSTARPPVIKEISHAGWTFRSIRSSISPAVQIEAISHKIGFPLPTMFFGSNRVEVSGPAGFSLTFDPIEAINLVSNSSESVPVRVAAARADFWRLKSEQEQIFDYDWTYSPQNYYGHLEGHKSVTQGNCEINYARLKLQDPILFFDENILYEDELGDNGISILSVKMRVMGYGFLILLSHYLRVDQVMFKRNTVRYYHEFSQNFMVRECKTCEDPFDAIMSRLLLTNSNFKDNEAVMQILSVQSQSNEQINL